MGKLVWHTLMSLDGFTAGPDDHLRWAVGLRRRVYRPTVGYRDGLVAGSSPTDDFCPATES